MQQGYVIQKVRSRCKIIATFKEIEVTGESVRDSVSIMLFPWDRKNSIYSLKISSGNIESKLYSSILNRQGFESLFM